MAYKSGTGSCGNMEFVDRRMFRARCPGSLAPITEVCDGDHAAPKCTDPVCWRDDDPDPANVAFPRGIKPSHSVSYDTETTGIDPSHAVAPVVTAVCSCGWRGPERAKIIEAGIDAGGHIKEVGAKSAEAST